MKRSGLAHCRGISLIELIVVLAIIAGLAALFLPAALASREASRRLHCSNNLRQVTLGLLHNQSQKRLPSVGEAGYDDWALAVLPHIEERSIELQFNKKFLPVDPVNAIPASMRLETLSCPSRPRQVSPLLENIPAANFGMNGNLAGLRVVWDSSKVPLVGETAGDLLFPWVFSPGFWLEDLGGWHAGGGLVAFADGHVIWAETSKPERVGP